MVSITELAEQYTTDETKRRAAQIARVLGTVDVDHIGQTYTLEAGPTLFDPVTLVVEVVRHIPPYEARAIARAEPLHATYEDGRRWPEGVRAEYRRQYDPTPTGSFAPRTPVHPDEVDRIADTAPTLAGVVLLDELAGQIRDAIRDATENGHRLADDCQGNGPGPKAPAVRAEVLDQILARFAR